MVFNMSVGYNLEGMLKPNVQWYFDTMADASEYLPAYIDIVAERYPAVRDIDIPASSRTRSPCRPCTAARPTRSRRSRSICSRSAACTPRSSATRPCSAPTGCAGIVNDSLDFDDVPIPDEAFGHDLKYVDAVPMFHNLRRVAASKGLTFGLKLTNTLEVDNWRTVFDKDEMMYLSGRALHAVTTNLASKISEEFRGDLMLSFAGGADCFNVADLLRSGMQTITVCSDLLKSGGYLRMLQYMENVDEAYDEVGAVDTADFIAKSALRQAGTRRVRPADAIRRPHRQRPRPDHRRSAPICRRRWSRHDGGRRTDRRCGAVAGPAEPGFDEERADAIVELDRQGAVAGQPAPVRRAGP